MNNFCWFCGKHKSLDESRYEVEMFRDKGKHVHYLYISIPRCQICKNAHNSGTRFMFKAIIVGFSCIILGPICVRIAIMIVPILGNILSWIVSIIGVGFIIIGLIGYIFKNIFLPKGIESESYFQLYPKVMQLVSEGWTIGKEDISRKENKTQIHEIKSNRGTFIVKVVDTSFSASNYVDMESLKKQTSMLHLSAMPSEDRQGVLIWYGTDNDKKSYNLSDLEQDAILYIPQDSMPYLEKNIQLFSRVKNIEVIGKDPLQKTMDDLMKGMKF